MSRKDCPSWSRAQAPHWLMPTPWPYPSPVKTKSPAHAGAGAARDTAVRLPAVRRRTTHTNAKIRDSLDDLRSVSYTHLRAHETKANLVCRLLLEKKKKRTQTTKKRRYKKEKRKTNTQNKGPI